MSKLTCRLKHLVFPENTRARLFAKMVYLALRDPKKAVASLNGANIRKLLKNILSNEPGLVENKLKEWLKTSRFIEDTPPYQKYLLNATPGDETLEWMKRVSLRLRTRPSVAFAVIADNRHGLGPEPCISSITSQTYDVSQIILCHAQGVQINPSTNGRIKACALKDLNKTLRETDADVFAFLEAGCALRPEAMFEAVKFMNMRPRLDLVYSDEDEIIGNKRDNPFFKPDWSPDLLLSMNYIGGFFLAKRDVIERIKDLPDWSREGAFYDLVLKATEVAADIGHAPKVLFTRLSGERRPNDVACIAIINEALKRRGIDAVATPSGREGIARVRRRINGNPLISIIIPTAYKRPDDLSSCLQSIAKRSTYRNHEIIIADNSSGRLSREILQGMVSPDTKITSLQYDRPFNYSEANNLAARSAKGEYLVFLNDDTEVLTPDWMEAMLEHAQCQDVGAVGAKLLYLDDTIQHAGVFLTDTGGAGRHAFRGLKHDTYHGLGSAARDSSAVTFACVMVRRDVFEKANGLDERLKIECNDVDFCLRVRNMGFNIVWTPFAVLRHRELSTRVHIDFPDDVKNHWARWGHLFEKGDPYYNPNLSLDADDFSVSQRPVIASFHGPRIKAWAFKKDDFLKRADIDPDGIRNVLAVKLDHIGDVVLSLPAIVRLKRKFPSANITVLAGPWARPILQMVPEVNEIITFNFFDERSERGYAGYGHDNGLEKTLKSKGFDLAVDLRRHPETRQILKHSGARHTIGYATGKDDDWMSVCLKFAPGMDDTASQPIKPHITEQLIRLVDSIPGATGDMKHDIESLMPDLSPVSRGMDCPLPDIKALNGASFVVGVHPGAGSSIRQWPVEHFARLADLFVEQDNAHVAIFGGGGEAALASAMHDLMKHRDKATNLAGRLDLKGFMSALAGLRLFIGNISGPAHMAGALKVPTLTIFSGQVVPHEWNPLGEASLSVRVALDCAPCYKAHPEQCPHNLKCLKMLLPGRVHGAAMEVATLSSRLKEAMPSQQRGSGI